jgi:hypothetical protein
LPLERLSQQALADRPNAQASKRTTLSISSPSGRDPSAHATAQADAQQKPERPADALSLVASSSGAARRPRTRTPVFAPLLGGQAAGEQRKDSSLSFLISAPLFVRRHHLD